MQALMERTYITQDDMIDVACHLYVPLVSSNATVEHRSEVRFQVYQVIKPKTPYDRLWKRCCCR